MTSTKTGTESHTEPIDSDELVDKGLTALASAHQIALSALDHVLETTSRVVSSNRAFVSDLLASVLEAPKSAAGSKSA